MNRAALWLVLVLLLCYVAAVAQADEWTRFRGPNGSGESDSIIIPATWTAEDYNWRVELPGSGHSSAVHWGEKIFLTSALQKGQTRIILCLDAADGRIVWKREYPAATHGVHQQNSYASSTLAVDKERVYAAVATPDQYRIVALAHDGREVWKADLGPFESQHGFGASPIVYQDMLIVNNDQDGESSLVALDAANGRPRWKTPRRTAVTAYSTPCIRQVAGAPPELVFNSQAHGISGIDPHTGATLWEIHVFDKRSVSSPVLASGLVFGSCGSGAGGNYVVAVRPGPNPEVVYKVDKFAPYVPTSVAKGDLLFLWADNGIVSCIKAATGDTVWQKRVGEGTFSGSPVRAGDKLVCVAVDGQAVVLAAEPEYKLLGRNALNETCRSTPSMAGGKIYFRTESHLISLGGK